jgi:hypothetical protein
MYVPQTLTPSADVCRQSWQSWKLWSHIVQYSVLLPAGRGPISGPRLIKKIIYRSAVSRRLRTTDLADYRIIRRFGRTYRFQFQDRRIRNQRNQQTVSRPCHIQYGPVTAYACILSLTFDVLPPLTVFSNILRDVRPPTFQKDVLPVQRRIYTSMKQLVLRPSVCAPRIISAAVSHKPSPLSKEVFNSIRCRCSVVESVDKIPEDGASIDLRNLVQ